MNRLIFSLFFPVLIINSAYANCQWSYVNELNKDIKYASGLLSDYSTCRDNCKSLEGSLNGSIAKMSQASSCGRHILTTANGDMINFISSRFRLIQKQKAGSTWTKSATAKPVIAAPASASVDEGVSPSLEMDRPAFVKPQVFKYTEAQSDATPIVQPPVVQAKRVAAPAAVARQTRMRISKEAYAELWPENVARRPAPRRNVQRAVYKQPQANQQAKQKQLAQQRLIQQRKQTQIQQAKQQLVLAKRRAMQNHVNRQQLLRKQFLKKRALMHHMNRLKVRRLRLARAAQRNRSR